MINPKDYKQIVYDIIGSAMEVHRELRWGMLEPLYNEALYRELNSRGIPCMRELPVPCYYKGQKMDKYYQLDLVVGDVIVELKANKSIDSVHRSQLFNYMRLTKKPIGLLINFGQPSLQGERYAYFMETNECVLLDKEMNIVRKHITNN